MAERPERKPASAERPQRKPASADGPARKPASAERLARKSAAAEGPERKSAAAEGPERKSASAERPARKRAAAAGGGVSAEPTGRKGFRAQRAAALARVEVEEAPSANYALRLTEALEAISAAQSVSDEAATPAAGDARQSTAPRSSPKPSGSFLAGLDKLPPIRLPVGPPIPWRVGLPALVALVVLMGVMSRSSAHADSPGVQLPAQQTYPVQQQAPLFTKAQPAQPSAGDDASGDVTNAAQQQTAQATPQDTAPASAAQPLGVQDPGGAGFDFFDLAIKLVAVLGLAYASLMLLKRVGIGGAAGARAGGPPQGMRVVSSLVLAPNRSVHVIKVPGGRTLLIGATPNAVNLLADLGELADEDAPDASSFFDVLKARLQ